MIVNKATVNSAKVVLVNSGNAADVIEDVRQMLEAKNSVLQHADTTIASGALLSEKAMLSHEVDLLHAAMNALGKNNVDVALRALDEYQQYLEAREKGVIPIICAECMPGKRPG